MIPLQECDDGSGDKEGVDDKVNEEEEGADDKVNEEEEGADDKILKRMVLIGSYKM